MVILGGLLGDISMGLLKQKTLQTDHPRSVAHLVPLNLGDCTESFFCGYGRLQPPAGESNLWETMCPLSPSSKTPLYQNTPIRKSIHEVAALFALPPLILPCLSLLPLFV